MKRHQIKIETKLNESSQQKINKVHQLDQDPLLFARLKRGQIKVEI